jgi:hypothetical protein
MSEEFVKEHTLEIKKEEFDESIFLKVLEKEFPGYMTLDEYVESVYFDLSKHGFNQKNTLPCICTCRDEVCLDAHNKFDDKYDPQAFDLSTLAGILFFIFFRYDVWWSYCK